jgi:hypothetical protein
VIGHLVGEHARKTRVARYVRPELRLAANERGAKIGTAGLAEYRAP